MTPPDTLPIPLPDTTIIDTTQPPTVPEPVRRGGPRHAAPTRPATTLLTILAVTAPTILTALAFLALLLAI
jgi:hypothetical protein